MESTGFVNGGVLVTDFSGNFCRLFDVDDDDDVAKTGGTSFPKISANSSIKSLVTLDTSAAYSAPVTTWASLDHKTQGPTQIARLDDVIMFSYVSRKSFVL